MSPQWWLAPIFIFKREANPVCCHMAKFLLPPLLCGRGLQGAAGSSICCSAASPAPGRAAGPLPGSSSCLSQSNSCSPRPSLDELMGGDFPNAFIPAVHPLFPKAGSTGQSPHWLPGDGEPSSGRGLFSPGWRWDRGSCHGAGVWTAPDCLHALAARPAPHPGCSAVSHLSIPGWGCPFPPSLLYSPWPLSRCFLC